MSSNKSGRVLVAAALTAALCLAVPAQAADARGFSPGPLERLTAWFVETWLSVAFTDGATATTADDSQTPPPPPPPADDEGDPEGCRDYTACVDPNG
jgi:hypothetical protein